MSTDTPAQIPSAAADLIAQLAGLAPEDNVTALRTARADATRFTQGSHDALLSADRHDLTLAERLYAAWYAAWLSPSPRAAQAYRTRLFASVDDAAQSAAWLDEIAASGVKTIGAQAGPRLVAILIHTHALITQPAATGQSELRALQAAGLSTRAIVALAQLVAFVSYQVRVVSAVQALKASEGLNAPEQHA